MAAVNSFDGSQILIKVGDGATPEVFTHPCLINADRAFTLNAETNQFDVPDCANPQDPGWKTTNKTSLSASISGSGMIERTDMALFDAWLISKDPKNIQIEVGGSGGRKYTGSFHLTSLEWTGTPKENATCTISLASTGAITPAALP